MSAGQFSRSFYETDGGTILSIRVQPETIIVGTNPAATGPATGEGSASATGGRRRLGINARRIRAQWTGEAPDGYDPDGTLTIPILTPTAYTTLQKGDTFTYLGEEVEVLGKTPEYVN